MVHISYILFITKSKKELLYIVWENEIPILCKNDWYKGDILDNFEDINQAIFPSNKN